MPWLKRNLFLVIGGLVALGLLGLAGFFLYTKMQLDQGVTDQLDQKTKELKRLVGRDPHPGTDKLNNIRAAMDESKKIQAFVAQVQEFFSSTRSDTNRMTSQQFRELLDTTIDELKHGAERAGVKTPDDYWFTFNPQKTAMTFQTNVVGSLAAQLSDIKALCEILYEAKVISLLGLRRMPVANEDSGQDFLTSKGSTNNWTVSTPYEVSFQGFSPELATVLEGIIRSKNCFVVRNIGVDRADSPHADDAAAPESSGNYLQNMRSRYGGMAGGFNPYSRGAAAPPAAPGAGGGMSPEMRARYGLGPPAVAPTATPTRSSNKGVFVEETGLRVTLSVDSIRLKPAGKPVKAAVSDPAQPAAPTQPVPPAQ